MIREQSAADDGTFLVECPTCGVGALAYADDSSEAAPTARHDDDVVLRVSRRGSSHSRLRRGTRLEIADTEPVFGVCIDCGFGLIVDPALYTVATRSAA